MFLRGMLGGSKAQPKRLMGRPEADGYSDRRLPFVLVPVALWAGSVFLRLVWLQGIQFKDYRAQAEKQHTSILTIQPVRGDLKDRRGLHLAVSRRVESLFVHPHMFYPDYRSVAGEARQWGNPDQELVDEVAAKLAPILELPKAKVAERLTRKKAFVFVQRKLMPSKVEAIKALKLEQLGFMVESLREYPMGSLACQILGFTDIDGQGMLGIERTHQALLAGAPGQMLAPKDAKGRFIVDQENYIKVPVNGSTLQLTIDSSIQHITEEALKEAVDRLNPKGAYAVVVDPNTGEILAIAGTPTFDPNHPLPKKFLNRSEAELSPAEKEELEHEKKRQGEARRVRAVEDTYEPGSTMKIFTVAIALEERKVHLGESIDCRGPWVHNGKPITDTHHHGALTMEEVLWQSSNIGTAKIGLRLEPTVHYQYLRKFGFGELSGLNFPGESAGLFQAPDRWSGTTQHTICYGYGISTTPLQILMAGCAIANGGKLMKPLLIQKVYNDSGTLLQEFKPQVRHQVISEETSAMMREVLKGVITNGTAKKAALDGVEAFGKTGTARKLAQGGAYNAGKHYSSFMGFFPVDKPQYGVLFMLDEPGGGLTGGDVAAPLFKKVGDAILRYRATGQATQLQPDQTLYLRDWPLSSDDEARIQVEQGKVPDVRGLPLKSAILRVSLAGGQVRFVEGQVVPEGPTKVITQTPEPGTALPKGAVVTLSLRNP